jgi:superfamily I DNA/RNA helicase/RecB family exonuclease
VPFSPDPAQAEVLAHRRGPLLVTGPAGTGKTTVLLERFVRLLEEGADPERTVLVLGSRRARDRAREGLRERLQRSLPSLLVTTIHGVAHRVLAVRHGAVGYAEPPRVLSAPEQLARVQTLLAEEDPADWPAYGSLLGMRGFADEVRQLLLRAQEAMRPPEAIAEAAEARRLSGWLELARFYRRYLDALADAREVDYAGLVWQAARAAGGGPRPFDHVLVDDLQDATLAGEELLRALEPESLVAAGDPEQHVFSFQGTTALPLRRFAERFAGARPVELVTRHRSPRGPVLEAWAAPHEAEELAAVARELRRIHVEEAVPWEEMAVVVRRQGPEVTALLRALDDAGVPRTVPESGPSLRVEPGVVPYLHALRWLARPEERDGLVETLLTSELARLSPAQARNLVRAARADGGGPADALGRTDALPPDRAEEVAALAAVLGRAGAVADRSVVEAFKLLWGGLPCSARLVAEADRDPDAARDLDAVVALARAVEEAGHVPVEAFLASFGDGTVGPGDGPAPRGGPRAVHVLTAHGAAGREFDTVIVVGAAEGNFPSLSRPEPMFDLDVLDRARTRSERIRDRVEDERRLFRMVVARARRRALLTVGDRHAQEDGETTRSRFADELEVVWTPAPAGPFEAPISTLEAAAAWRRELADHGAAPHRRLAALDGLLALGAEPAAWWYQRDWTDPGTPLREEVKVSASRLDVLENCELQFLLGQELGLEPPAGHYAWVGHLVHRLIQEVEEGKLPRDLDRVVEEAGRRWRPGEFPSRTVSDTFRRLVAEVMLPAWFAEYGDAPAVATERSFEFAFEGATLRGYIDRIGRVQSGGSQITDFKTGRRRNARPAEENLQLGVYYLAVNHAEDLAPFRPVRAVELVFLRDRGFRGDGIGRLSMAFTGGNEPAYREAVVERIREGIGRLRRLYAEDVVRPNPAANCRFCAFKPLCPLYPEGQELFPPHAPGEAAR